jgi:hypothetical protein
MPIDTAPECRHCAKNGRRTPMLVRFPGAASICPECDRKKCGSCKYVLIEGTEQRCPQCRRDTSLMRKGN